MPILIGKDNIKYKYSDKINILSMNGKIENDPSVLICVKSARTFRVHFNFIALNFFFCDSKSNEREGLESRDFFFGLTWCFNIFIFFYFRPKKRVGSSPSR